ncbi:MAG: DUF4384 domain-containing protein [Syntrophobacteraceae bacterium]
MGAAGVMRLFVSLCLFFALFSGQVCSAAATGEKEKEGPKFRWAFGALRGSAGAPKVEPVSGTSVLKSGDKLKIMIELRKKCFVYLFHHNAQSELALLFPYDLKQFDADYQPGRGYYVPKGDAWFQLDNKPGSETFYLIGSDQRLLDVEYLYARYVSADPEKRPEIAGRMLAEIKSLSDQYRASSGEPELLAQNEAAQRGFERATGADPTDVAGLAVDIAFNNMYSDVIVIEHR